MARFTSAALVVAFALFLGQPANAAVITYDRVSFDAAFPGAMLETWDGLASGTVIADGSTVNGITYSTSTAGDALVTSSFVTSTGANGLGDTEVGFFGAADTVTFSFASPVSAFGIDVNTFDSVNGGYSGTTNAGDVVLSGFDPFPGLNTGQFLGFSSTVAFTSITIASLGGFTYTLDTLRYVPAQVPEPSALLLVGVGLAAAGLRRRRKSA